jgi:hypothetical protein
LSHQQQQLGAAAAGDATAKELHPHFDESLLIPANLPTLVFPFVTGAIQTIEKLLKNAEKRAAAITTLGKTVERCRPKLGAANPAFLASLFNVLDGVTEQTFQYDIEWINNNMQRTRPQQVGHWFVC